MFTILKVIQKFQQNCRDRTGELSFFTETAQWSWHKYFVYEYAAILGTEAPNSKLQKFLDQKTM